MKPPEEGKDSRGLKILTVLGTRPEIIRLSRILPKLDRWTRHTLVHTGQNFDRGLSDVFFEQLELRSPDLHLGIRGKTFGDQAGAILREMETVLDGIQPDRLLLLGDTNSALSAIVAKRRGIPVYHMEAGNRCYDDRVPEEINRRLVDHSSDVLLPYTERSRANLLREGIEGDRIFVIGNPIREVIEHYRPSIEASGILDHLGLRKEGYFLVTLHRQENVDVLPRLRRFFEALRRLHAEHGLPVVVSVHPRTRNRLDRAGFEPGKQFEGAGVLLQPPFGLFDFLALERSAFCVLSDSGTVQEECALFGVANVTLRDVTERPETLECGSNMLSGAEPEQILDCVKLVTAADRSWRPPREYTERNVSDRVLKILLGYRRPAPDARTGGES